MSILDLDNSKVEKLIEADEMEIKAKAVVQKALDEAKLIREGVGGKFVTTDGVYRKRGETNRDFIKTLSAEVVRLKNIIAMKDLQIAEAANSSAMVPVSKYNEALATVQDMRNKLIRYGLWCGE